MEKVLTAKVVEDILEERFPASTHFQKCSFITPKGKYLIVQQEHYEAFRWLVIEQLVQCIPDAEQVLYELGYIRYSYIGYVTLPLIEPTAAQYKALEFCLYELNTFRDTISIQVANNPRYYEEVDLTDNITKVMKHIKSYYKKGVLKNV